MIDVNKLWNDLAMGVAEDAERNTLLDDKRIELLETISDLYNKANCGYHSLDCFGNYLLINDTELAWLGYSREEVIGHPLNDFVTPEYRHVFRDNFPRFLRDGVLNGVSIRYLRKDGTEFPAIIHANAIYDAVTKKYLRSSSTAIDMSTQEALNIKQAEVEKLRIEKEAAEAAAAAKTQFLANMSHEMRTPMNAILGMNELVLEATTLTDMQRKNLSIVRGASRRLLHLINEILDLSKIESGNVEILNVPFELSDVVAESMSVCRGLADKKNLKLSSEISRGIPHTVIGDPHKLYQILTNLMGNAIKFTEAGEVKLSAERVCHNTEAFALLFSISDTGIGIPKPLISKLFTYFGQLDSSMTKKYGGSGLGLAISKAFVEMMGGSIWVESEVGVGSTFHFTIDCPPA